MGIDPIEPGFRRNEAHGQAPHAQHRVQAPGALGFLVGETLHWLAKHHDVCQNLIRIWVQKDEAGAFERGMPFLRICSSNTKPGIAGRYKRFSSATFMELEFLKGAVKNARFEKREYVRHCRPRGLGIAEGCRLMGIARSTCYDEPTGPSESQYRLSG